MTVSLFFSLVFPVSLLCCQSKEKESYGLELMPETGRRIAVPVFVKHQAMLISGIDEVSIVCLSNLSSDGANYSCRHYSIKKKIETKNNGKVYWRFKKSRDPKDGKVLFIDDGSRIRIQMLKVYVIWSPRDTQSCWIYYDKDLSYVELIDIRYFDALDLSTVIRRPVQER